MKRLLYTLLVGLLFVAACRPQETAPQATAETAATTPTPTTTTPTTTPTPGAATAAPAGVQGLLTRLETDGDPRVGTVPVVVYLLEDGEGVSGATVEITGDMTHAGMAPVTARAEETEPGLYRAEGFEFTMAGDWLLSAAATLPSGDKATAELGVTVPGQ